jgi:hypothetical protein
VTPSQREHELHIMDLHLVALLGGARRTVPALVPRLQEVRAELLDERLADRTE